MPAATATTTAISTQLPASIIKPEKWGEYQLNYNSLAVYMVGCVGWVWDIKMAESAQINIADGAKEVVEQSATRPRLSFETITFSDGAALSLEDDDIVVFVGPNNVGKSATLRELEAHVARDYQGLVIKGTKLRRVGTGNDLLAFLRVNAQMRGVIPERQFSGFGFDIHEANVNYFDNPNDRSPVASFFAKRLDTDGRIQGSNPAGPIALYQSPPSHPIHSLLMDSQLAKDVSEKFRHAFGKDLTPFRAGGGQFPLLVGAKPIVSAERDELSKEFVEEILQSSVPLESQGDGMRSFATVILNVFAVGTQSILFLDEPEAFLHPPQARLLGRYIAENRSRDAQLFIATHSTDILDGLIEGGSEKIRIVRLRRDDNVNRVKELNREQTAAIARDTLARFSGVFDGIFFEHVIVCEADADCMFYQSILNLPSISGERRPDVKFVHTAGKHRMAKVAATLRLLDVPVSVICDIDILNDEIVFKNLFEAMGGDWNNLRSDWQSVSDAVLGRRPPLNADQVVKLIEKSLDGVSGLGDFPDKAERDIKEVFRAVSPWSELKRSGREGLPAGEVTKRFDELYKKCSDIGLWIVPVGEVERFCQSIGSHGPKFVEKVIEERDLETDEELNKAREFVKKIWDRAKP